MTIREELHRMVDAMPEWTLERVHEFARRHGVFEPAISPGPALTDEDLTNLMRLSEIATPGPWYVRRLDDDHAMGLIAVSTINDARNLRWPKFDHNEIVLATLIQQPRYVDHAAGRHDEDAAFVVAARDAVPRLIAEIRTLRHAQAAP